MKYKRQGKTLKRTFNNERFKNVFCKKTPSPLPTYYFLNISLLVFNPMSDNVTNDHCVLKKTTKILCFYEKLQLRKPFWSLVRVAEQKFFLMDLQEIGGHPLPPFYLPFYYLTWHPRHVVLPKDKGTFKSFIWKKIFILFIKNCVKVLSCFEKAKTYIHKKKWMSIKMSLLLGEMSILGLPKFQIRNSKHKELLPLLLLTK